jgi:selenide,water dikinase
VYAWDEGPALVQTVDFFTPIVDDPFIYGQIAAANALSDVYAMGGEPRTALAIAAFPKDDLDHETIAAIFRGGYEKLREAGTVLLGGHTVQDREIKFGYAVTGAVPRDRILTNAGARSGDVLILTKPIGTGVVGTSIKFGRTTKKTVDAAVESMRTLNRAAAEALANVTLGSVHACTDVTGFGLIGHSTEMAAASAATLVITAGTVPLLPGVTELVAANGSGGMSTNRAHFSPTTDLSGLSKDLADLLFDPQTSGGLLAAVERQSAPAALAALARRGVSATIVGEVRPASAFRVVIA